MGISANGNRTPNAHGIAQSVVMGNVHIQNTRIYFGRFADSGFLGHGFLKRSSAIIDLTNLQALFASSGSRTSRQSGSGFNLNGSGRGSYLRRAGTAGLSLMSKSTAYRRRWLWIQGAQLSELDIRFAKMARTKGWGRRNVYKIDAAGVLTPADFAGTKTFKIEGIPIRTPTVLLGRFCRLRPNPR